MLFWKNANFPNKMVPDFFGGKGFLLKFFFDETAFVRRILLVKARLSTWIKVTLAGFWGIIG